MILFLTNAASEILALRSLVEGLPDGFPPRAGGPGHRPPRCPDLDGVEVVLVRLLGGAAAWAEPFDELRRRCRAGGIPLLAFGGEAAPDAELTAASTVPSATVAQAFEYLVHGGLGNLEHLLRFVVDTVCMTGLRVRPARRGARHRRVRPAHRGHRRRTAPGRRRLLPGPSGRREHRASSTTCATPSRPRGARATRRRGATACARTRPGRVDALELPAASAPDVADHHRAGGGQRSRRRPGRGMRRPWAASASRCVQAIAATTSRAEWEAASGGLWPLDVAMRVALPEFDGRIVAVPFSFNEEVDDGDELGAAGHAYRTVPDRVDRVAGLAVRLARLAVDPAAGPAGGHRAVRLPDQAQPDRQRRRRSTPRRRSSACCAPWPAPGYRVDRIPPTATP